MHIPPYYKKESWQRFLAGVFIGGVIAYIVFLFMYGNLTERWVEENIKLHSQISKLEREYKLLSKDKAELDRQSKEKIEVRSIEIEFTNDKKLKIDKLIAIQLKDLIKDQISNIIGNDISNVTQNRNLLISAIENKHYKIDDFTYTVKIQHLTISSTMFITIQINIYNS